MSVTLFGAAYSVYTRSARLALIEKGVPYRFDEVHVFGPGGAPTEHLARQPFGKVPAFEHDGFALFETAAILRYVDEAFSGPALQPVDTRSRARMTQAMSVCDSYLYGHGVWGIFVERVAKAKRGEAADEQKVAASLPKVAACHAVLADILGDQDHLCGDALTLADLHAAPMLACLAMTDEGRAMMAAHPRLEKWWQRMGAWPAMVQTRAGTDV
ncbi:glutathione S-transferase family protein [Ferrovibrio terrae]|uniref:glutathione S-transferase family protein n=1 Tax=Ferrovibrio terrae TaxID=2594003 RepID=UPI001C8FA5AB|nr:glutathione S-transferase family protein [Ferrovibrio terrae]